MIVLSLNASDSKIEQCPICGAWYNSGTYHKCPEKPFYPEVSVPSAIIDESATKIYGAG